MELVVDKAKGYKQTDVGLIPKDWKLNRIGEFSMCFSGGTPNTSIREYYNGEIEWITSGDLNQKRIKEVAGRISKKGLDRSAAKKINKGTLLIALYGATAGVTAISEIDAAINQAILAIVPSGVDNEFLYQKLSFLKDWIITTYTQGGQPNLSGDIIKRVQLSLPPTRAEQTAIATALNDADSLVQSLEKLIAKKRLIKQGTTQELLKPKKGWRKMKLSEVAILKARIGWQGLTTKEYKKTGDYYLVTGTDFKGGYIDWQNCFYVDEGRFKQDKYIQIKEHDVLVTKDGTIGKVAIVKSLPKPGTLNSGVFVIRPTNRSFHPEFFYYILLSKVFLAFLSQLSAGSTINHLYQKDFVSFEFSAPKELGEQERVATILSEMDAEINGLEDKLKKYKMIKQGMMQNLLTGKIRLV